MRGARAAPVYLRVIIMFCDMSVFMTFIILSDIIFFRKDLDIIYLVIND